MSQSTAVRVATRPATRHAVRTAPPPPRLRVVSAPAQARSRAGLVFACIALLAAGLVGLLLLNVSLERGAYELQAQQKAETQLQEQQQALQERLAAVQAPQNLAAAATKLGMVRNPNAAFIQPGDGKVLGVPRKATAAPTPSVTASSPKASGSPKPTRATAGSTGTGTAATGKRSPAPAPTATKP